MIWQRAATAEEKRNQITHSVWATGGDADTITRTKTTVKGKHGIRFHFENVTLEDLASFVREIKALAAEVQDFSSSLAGKPFRSPSD